MCTFPTEIFEECGNYYELKAPQRSAEWLAARKERITASIFAQAAGHSCYKSRKELLEEMAGISQPKPFGYIQLKAMEAGTCLEPYVRWLYNRTYKRNAQEKGLVIPKWCPRIGVSVDGYMKEHNAIIEIKCPMNMYKDLAVHSKDLEHGKKFPKLYHAQISPDHYAQMQGGMAILDVEYCDYIVFVQKTMELCVTRVFRNREYWDTELYPKLMSFLKDLDNLKSPLLQEEGVSATGTEDLLLVTS